MSSVNVYSLERAQGYEEFGDRALHSVHEAIKGFTKKPFEDMKFLDVGGGTGTLAKLLLDGGACHVTLLDANETMLRHAKNKLKDYITAGRCSVMQHAIPDKFPSEISPVDAVLMVGVIHFVDHILEQEPFTYDQQINADHYENALKAMNEVHHILKPGGLAFAFGRTRAQSRWLWYTQCLPESVRQADAYTCKVIEVLPEIFTNAGLSDVHVVPLLDLLEDDPFHAEGPLNPMWRASDSIFETATDDQIKDMEKELLEKKRQGTLEKYYSEIFELYTKKNGTKTMYVGIKNSLE